MAEHEIQKYFSDYLTFIYSQVQYTKLKLNFLLIVSDFKKVKGHFRKQLLLYTIPRQSSNERKCIEYLGLYNISINLF